MAMRKLGDDIRRAVRELSGNSEAARINLRSQQVRSRYKRSIESVYDEQTARYHLAHTNSVIIRRKNGVKTLTVYVDDSACAADLNAQRELIVLQLLQLFGEEIEDFEICISKWKKYREMHPYAEDLTSSDSPQTKTKPLNVEDSTYVDCTSAKITDEKLQKAFKKAMTADLTWKRGEKVETERMNRK